MTDETELGAVAKDLDIDEEQSEKVTGGANVSVAADPRPKLEAGPATDPRLRLEA